MNLYHFWKICILFGAKNASNNNFYYFVGHLKIIPESVLQLFQITIFFFTFYRRKQAVLSLCYTTLEANSLWACEKILVDDLSEALCKKRRRAQTSLRVTREKEKSGRERSLCSRLSFAVGKKRLIRCAGDTTFFPATDGCVKLGGSDVEVRSICQPV